MNRFRFDYDPDSILSAQGAAYIKVGDIELTHDCGSPVEMDKAIDGLIAELQGLKKTSRRAFEKAWALKTAKQGLA